MNARDLPYITRILAPQKRPDILHRERLVDFLHEQVECRLILVSAPAGYGKTTLLVDFVHSVQAPVCWYSLSDNDKDPKVFLEYLVASMRQRFPGFGEKTLGLLGSVTDLAKDLSSIVGILVNEIHESIPEYFFVVLDDYHHADDSPSVNEALDLLLYYLPSNCHIILASRSLPKLTLSRLAAQRLVAGLGTSDLRFTVQEIRDFLRASFKVLLPESMAQDLADNSEGWITGIVLSTYGLGQGMLETIMRARSSGGPVFDYLANEVFAQQSPDVQSFLLDSSILTQFNAQRCREILGVADARDMLKTVEERNLFLTRTEGSDWYRYHNLFAEFLQAKLKEESPERYVDLSVHAAEVCYQRGELEDTIQHYARAGQYDEVIKMIEANGEQLLDVGQLRTLQRWLEVPPLKMVEANPTLLMLRGRILSHVSELDKALESFSRAIEQFERKGDHRSAARTIAKRSTVFRLMGFRQEAIDDCLRVLRLAEDDVEAVAEARKGIGILRGVEGKFHESIPELKRSLALYETLGSTYQMAELNHALGMAHYSQGDLATAFHYWRQALKLWEKQGHPGFAAEILNSLAMISYWRGDYEEALQTLRDAVNRARQSGYLRVEAHILGSMGTVLRDMDDFDEALRVSENGLDLARRVNEVFLIGHFLAEIGGIYRLRGDLTRAERLIRQALAQAQEYKAPREAALYELYLGLIAYDRELFGQATSQLTKACRGLRAAGARRELARAQYCLANSFLAQGRDGDAEKQMRSVDQIVSALGYETFLLTDVRRAPQVAEFSAARGIGSEWLGRLRRRFIPPGKQPTPSPVVRELTEESPHQRLSSIRVYALGRERVSCGDREVSESEWSTQSAKELFYYLVSQPRGARREEVMSSLWPEISTARANSSFHVAMYRLRRATFPELLIHQSGRYLLNPAIEVWYDVEEFEACVNKALNCGANSDQAIPYWEKAATLYDGPFLARFYNEWCESKRRGLEERYLQAMGALARYHLRQGEFSAGIACYEKVLAVDPYTEEVSRQLIRAYELAGDRPAAIRQYNRLVQILRDELGSEPSPETVAVYDSLLRGVIGTNPGQVDKDNRSGGLA